MLCGLLSAGDSTINADAVSNGQGGRVIVWADETTRFNGNISARGGLFSGNGGFAEVSGKQSLDFQGLVDLRSTFGIAGTLLLDPTDITIISGGENTGGSLEGGAFAPSASTSTINNQTLQNQLGFGNVTISTESSYYGANQGNITVSAPISWTTNTSLTLKANNSICVKENITANGGSITLNADVDGQNGGTIAITAIINSNGGNIILGGGSNPLSSPALGTAQTSIGVFITNSTLNAGTGNISIRGQGRPGEAANEGISVSNSTITTAGAGSITLNGTGGGNGGGTGEFLFSPRTHGISVSNNSTITTAGTGSIILNGTGGNGTSGDNNGINIVSSTVESIGAGSITLTGTGGNGTNRNLGISIETSKVRSAGGNITLTGTGGGTGIENVGVKVIDSTVESTANGAVTIIGTGAVNGTDGNTGIVIGKVLLLCDRRMGISP
jgi:hypothetical protein